MLARRREVLGLGLPHLVAQLDKRVVGYTYAGTYRPRPAYRYTVEDSVYIADGLGGRGIGKALLKALIARCEAGPWRQELVGLVMRQAPYAKPAVRMRFEKHH